ncbi:MAG: 50S ribosomal protein L25/general stress protein Ctc [Gammaproteobacteria bacterium]|nr:50S ribosomal protein L25/general stress protein Ctc [Gammaproteobacteria bacterium]
MSTAFILDAELRTDQGKGASRRLRHANKVPAIIYGDNKEATNISLVQHEVQHQLHNESFYSHILTIKVGKVEEQVILRDLQRHPYRAYLLHLDFQRVSKGKALHVHVPLHFINEAKNEAIKQGGVLNKVLSDVEISCLPKDLPEYIEVDIQGLTLGHSIHLTEVKLPKGVSLVALSHGDVHEHDTAVVTIQKSRAAVEDEPAVGGEPA